MNEVEFVEVDAIPVDESHVATNRDAEKYGHFRGIQLVELQRKEVGVLIGTDCSNAFSVFEVRKAKQNEPIAWKTHYGWCLLGEVGHGARKEVLYNAFVDARTRRDDAVHQQLEKIFRQDFPEAASEKLGPSQQDLRAEKILQESCVDIGGRY